MWYEINRIQFLSSIRLPTVVIQFKAFLKNLIKSNLIIVSSRGKHSTVLCHLCRNFIHKRCNNQRNINSSNFSFLKLFRVQSGNGKLSIANWGNLSNTAFIKVASTPKFQNSFQLCQQNVFVKCCSAYMNFILFFFHVNFIFPDNLISWRKIIDMISLTI